MWFHLDTLSWFRSNQSLFLLINDVCLDEKQQISMMQVFILTRLWLELTTYRTYYYTTYEVNIFEEKNGHIVENLLIVIYQKTHGMLLNVKWRQTQ